MNLGITFAYSAIVVPPLLTHSSPKLLAKQWLQAYQYGPRFVPTLILSGTLSNALLAYFSPSTKARSLYILAAIEIWSIMPYTFLYMEPGINGAGKWKAQSLLRDEGVTMEENGRGIPDVRKHTAAPDTRKWAEGKEMKDIVQRWSEINHWRWVIMSVATVTSGAASNWPW